MGSPVEGRAPDRRPCFELLDRFTLWSLILILRYRDGIFTLDPDSAHVSYVERDHVALVTIQDLPGRIAFGLKRVDLSF